jgi:hypothetical protein
MSKLLNLNSTTRVLISNFFGTTIALSTGVTRKTKALRREKENSQQQ